MDYRFFFGYAATAIGLGSYGPYFWGIYKGQIKPHGFTFFVWGVLTGIGFVAQLVSGGGPGSWLFVMYSVLCFIIAGIAFYQGHVKYVLFDWIALFGALLGIVLWWWTKNPLTAVILISLSDGIAFLPSIRKSYYFPNEESPGPWIWGIISHTLAIFALITLNLTTVLYPVCVIAFDISYVLLVVIRRRQLKG